MHCVLVGEKRMTAKEMRIIMKAFVEKCPNCYYKNGFQFIQVTPLHSPSLFLLFSGETFFAVPSVVTL